LSILLDWSNSWRISVNSEQENNYNFDQNRSSYEKFGKRKGPPTEIVQPWDFGAGAAEHILFWGVLNLKKMFTVVLD
jgi:hypothetical protein